jgi:hypothetical protein
MEREEKILAEEMARGSIEAEVADEARWIRVY